MSRTSTRGRAETARTDATCLHAETTVAEARRYYHAQYSLTRVWQVAWSVSLESRQDCSCRRMSEILILLGRIGSRFDARCIFL